MHYAFVKFFGLGLEICRSRSRFWSKKNYRVSDLVSVSALAFVASTTSLIKSSKIVHFSNIGRCFANVTLIRSSKPAFLNR